MLSVETAIFTLGDLTKNCWTIDICKCITASETSKNKDIYYIMTIVQRNSYVFLYYLVKRQLPNNHYVRSSLDPKSSLDF